MHIDPELLDILRCPKTLKPLRLLTETELGALNDRIRDRQLHDATGRVRADALEGGLVPEGEAVVYPIEQGIPVLLVDEAIPLPGENK